ncbi:MAG: hypothetical protein II506_07835 [Lachnospiraceae bacterium]|nr:hypothetical protein [Lachnospiraceae bacterium]
MDKYIKFSDLLEYLRNRNDEARRCGHEETYFDLLTIIDGLKNMETVPASAVGKDTNVPAKWIPFTAETMPKEDGEYFVLYDDKYAEDYDTGRVGVADFYEDCEAFGYWQSRYDPVTFGFVDSDFIEIKVKKWMPIPKDEGE